MGWRYGNVRAAWRGVSPASSKQQQQQQHDQHKMVRKQLIASFTQDPTLQRRAYLIEETERVVLM